VASLPALLPNPVIIFHLAAPVHRAAQGAAINIMDTMVKH
jgi:hypothetical protein